MDRQGTVQAVRQSGRQTGIKKDSQNISTTTFCLFYNFNNFTTFSVWFRKNGQMSEIYL